MQSRSRNYQICNTCIMDTSDKTIEFDDNGTCNYCLNYKKNIAPIIKKNIANEQYYISNFKKNLKKNKATNKSKYDCLIGLSGGVDSSYLVYYAVNILKLNPLILHVDTGWNSKTAVSNIEKIIEKLNLDLDTLVIDWNEMKDLSRSFFLSQVPNVDTVQDHAIWAGMYNYAKENNFKDILTGGNLHTESYKPPLYISYHAGDLTQINDIQGKFGKLKLKKFPRCDIFKYRIYYRYFHSIKLHQPLNYCKYNKSEATNILTDFFEWSQYGGKHQESNFTKFLDQFWKPEKFGYDNRRNHYSSLIASGQLDRDNAIMEIKKNIYNEQNRFRDFNYISSKLDMTVNELEDIFNGQNKYHYDYKSKDFVLKIITIMMRIFGLEKRVVR